MNRIAHSLNVLRQQEEKGKFLLSRVLWYTGLGRFFRIERGGFAMRFYPSGLSVKMWLDPEIMRVEEDFIGEYLQAGDVMLDIGANVGLMSLRAAATIGEKGRVLAFEPHPVVISYLEGNIRLNGFRNIKTHNVALGKESDRSIGLKTSKTDDMSQVSEGGEGLSVPLARLDDFDADISGEVALLKIDVEGYEKFVFEGGPKVLRRTKCILFEACEEHYRNFDYGSPEVFEFLTAQGFSIYRWKGDLLSEVAMDEQIEDLDNLIAARELDDLLDRTGFRIN